MLISKGTQCEKARLKKRVQRKQLTPESHKIINLKLVCALCLTPKLI